ncbi:MAG: sugar phosphate isomerase/epimerase [Anaerolineae bacterium]|nr:sugar phosphate isomerase/epimerase [Anaerolineae bacterium]
MWKLSIINDELSHDFKTSLDWIQEQGLRWVELRSVNRRNIVDLSDDEMQAVKKELDGRGIKTICIASPYLKCSLYAHPPAERGDTFFSQAYDYEGHRQVLRRAIAAAHIFGTNLVRVFSFWKEPEQTPEMWDLIVERLQESALIAAEEGITLALETEHAVNAATGKQVRELVDRVGSSALRSLWDPGNVVWAGEDAIADYPNLRGTIIHVHLKDAILTPEGQTKAAILGEGKVGYPKPLELLKADGWEGGLSLEPHMGTIYSEEKQWMEGCGQCLTNLRGWLDEMGVEYE